MNLEITKQTLQKIIDSLSERTNTEKVIVEILRHSEIAGKKTEKLNMFTNEQKLRDIAEDIKQKAKEELTDAQIEEGLVNNTMDASRRDYILNEMINKLKVKLDRNGINYITKDGMLALVMDKLKSKIHVRTEIAKAKSEGRRIRDEEGKDITDTYLDSHNALYDAHIMESIKKAKSMRVALRNPDGSYIYKPTEDKVL